MVPPNEYNNVSYLSKTLDYINSIANGATFSGYNEDPETNAKLLWENIQPLFLEALAKSTSHDDEIAISNELQLDIKTSSLDYASITSDIYELKNRYKAQVEQQLTYEFLKNAELHDLKRAISDILKQWRHEINLDAKSLEEMENNDQSYARTKISHKVRNNFYTALSNCYDEIEKLEKELKESNASTITAKAYVFAAAGAILGLCLAIACTPLSFSGGIVIGVKGGMHAGISFAKVVKNKYTLGSLAVPLVIAVPTTLGFIVGALLGLYAAVVLQPAKSIKKYATAGYNREINIKKQLNNKTNDLKVFLQDKPKLATSFFKTLRQYLALFNISKAFNYKKTNHDVIDEINRKDPDLIPTLSRQLQSSITVLEDAINKAKDQNDNDAVISLKERIEKLGDFGIEIQDSLNNGKVEAFYECALDFLRSESTEKHDVSKNLVWSDYVKLYPPENQQSSNVEQIIVRIQALRSLI